MRAAVTLLCFLGFVGLYALLQQWIPGTPSYVGHGASVALSGLFAFGVGSLSVAFTRRPEP